MRKEIGVNPEQKGLKIKIELEGTKTDALRTNNLKFSYDRDTAKLRINLSAWGRTSERIIGGIYSQVVKQVDLGRENLTEAEIIAIENALKKFLE